MKTPIVNLTLSHAKKDQTNPSIYTMKSLHNEVVHRDFDFVYTDGRVLNENAAAAAIKLTIIHQSNAFQINLLYFLQSYMLYIKLLIGLRREMMMKEILSFSPIQSLCVWAETGPIL